MIKHRRRVGPIFGPVINWKGGFEMEVSFRTIIQRYGNGIEERESLITEPRFRFVFTANFMGEDSEDYISELSRFYDRTWYFPLPFRSVWGLVSGNAGNITIADAPFWVQSGAWVVVQTDTVRELAQVGDYTGGTRVPLVNPLLEARGNAQVFQALPVNLEADTQQRLLTLDLYETKVALVNLPGEAVMPFLDFEPEITLDGIPVFTRKPNWRNDVKHDLAPAMRRSDLGFGRRYQRMMYDFVTSTRKMDYMFHDQYSVEQYLSVLNHMKGRRLPFWYPAWGALLDKRPDGPTTPSQQVRFYPLNAHLGPNYSGSKTHRNLFFELLDGRQFARRITEFQVAFDPHYLGFASLPTPLNDNTFYLGTWLTLNRFASDTTIFRFQTSTAGELEMSMQILPTREVQEV